MNPTGQNWYDAGSIVEVSETPQGGTWIFDYWELGGENVGSSQTYTVAMDSPQDLIANFIDAQIQSKLVNVTDSYGNNLRNPDGTFYRLDKFEIQYEVVIVGGNSILPPSITFVVNVTYPQNVLSETENGSDFSILHGIAKCRICALQHYAHRFHTEFSRRFKEIYSELQLRALRGR